MENVLPKYLIRYRDPEKRMRQRREAQSRYRKTEKGKAQKKKYLKTPSAKAKRVKSTAKWRLRNKIKNQAHNMVNSAIHSGRLTKKPCEVCGELKVHGHHDDYFKPLEVKWLCQKHHQEIHCAPAYKEAMKKLLKSPL